jgi:hypothetical protein
MTDDTAELLALEERAWEANRNGDADWYEERLTGDAIVVSRWGVAERDAILEGFAANRIRTCARPPTTSGCCAPPRIPPS